jgi:very-short-patch-repair endonuclease
MAAHPQGGRAPVPVHRFAGTPVDLDRDPQILVVKSDTLIEHLLTDDPVLLVRDHRYLRHAVLRGTEAGRLRRLLPGVYVDAGRADEVTIKATAVARWDPSAVICGRAAAALTYWPEIAVGPLLVASPVRHAGQRGFTFVERRIPPDLVREVEHVRTTVPALTAVELATSDFTDPIDIALRKRVASLPSMHQAIELTRHRRGHTDRRRVLLDSRDEPWSAAERLAQRIYRRAGIDGWSTNLKTVVPDVGTYYLDFAFRRERVASEIDGRLHESDVDLFESDRVRQNALMLRGWLVLRFTWHMLDQDPAYVVATTREALAQRRTNAGFRGFYERDTPWSAG